MSQFRFVSASSEILAQGRRVTPINFSHDRLCPPDRIGNGAHRGRYSRATLLT
jgi:hypothetical protein